MRYKIFILSLILTSGLFMAGDTFAQRTGATGVEQDNVAKALALGCSGLIESIARNPNAEDNLVGIYNAFAAKVLSLNLPNSSSDIAEAKGMIAKEVLLGVGRNPSLASLIVETAMMCEADVDSLR